MIIFLSYLIHRKTGNICIVRKNNNGCEPSPTKPIIKNKKITTALKAIYFPSFLPSSLPHPKIITQLFFLKVIFAAYIWFLANVLIQFAWFKLYKYGITLHTISWNLGFFSIGHYVSKMRLCHCIQLFTHFQG